MSSAERLGRKGILGKEEGGGGVNSLYVPAREGSTGVTDSNSVGRHGRPMLARPRMIIKKKEKTSLWRDTHMPLRRTLTTRAHKKAALHAAQLHRRNKGRVKLNKIKMGGIFSGYGGKR